RARPSYARFPYTWLFRSLSVVVIAAVMFGILARYQAAVSEAERASAASHSLSALSLSSLDSDPAWAIMLALAAHRSEPGQHTERSEEHTSELQSREKLVC